jgi:long-chain acyl-CoA synthetase
LEADLGLDSIERIELLSAIEGQIGRLVDERQMTPQTTVGDLRKLAEAGAPADAVSMPYTRWPRSPWAKAVRRTLLRAAFRLQDLWMDIEVVHPERIGKIPLPSILIFNYQGPYAPLLILRALPPRARDRVAMAVDARIWHGSERWQGMLATLATQAFPIPKGGGAVRPSLEAFGRYLDDGYAVITSPEGEPEQEGRLLPFQRGTGLLAVEMQAPIVPFKLEGYDRLFPRNPRFPYLPQKRGRVQLIVGEPITIPRDLSYDEATERVQQALIDTH